MQAIALTHKHSIIEQIAQGKRLAEICPQFGLSSPNSISKILKNDPDYRSAIESGLEVRLDKAERDIETAVEQVDVARARSYWSAIAWRAERECPGRWGQRTQIDVSIDLSQALAQLSERLRAVAAPQQIGEQEIVDVTEFTQVVDPID